MEREWWDLSPGLRAQMTEVARKFRKEPTLSEGLLWQELRNRKLSGRKFRRQYNIGPFIVDFYCSEERLIVEVDGPIHSDQKEADRERQQLLEYLGLRFVRLTAFDVEHNMDMCLATINAAFDYK